MNSMKTTNANEFSFEDSNSILLVGQSGSGKSYLVHKYIDKLKSSYGPDEVKFAIFDLKAVEFNEDEIGREYLLFDIQNGGEQGLNKLDELSTLAKERASNGISKPMLFIYIEECDLACIDQNRFDNAVIAINQNAKAANIKLIYSTSSPRTDTVSKKLLDSFDQLLIGAMDDYDYDFLNMDKSIMPDQYDFSVIRIQDQTVS